MVGARGPQSNRCEAGAALWRGAHRPGAARQTARLGPVEGRGATSCRCRFRRGRHQRDRARRRGPRHRCQVGAGRTVRLTTAETSRMGGSDRPCRDDSAGCLRSGTHYRPAVSDPPAVLFVFAPLAKNWPAIRLRVPGSANRPIPSSAPSTTSVAVRLVAGDELLGRIDIQRSQIMVAARWTKPWKWMVRRS